MQPRIPRPSLYQKPGANIALIAITWTLVAVKIIGLGIAGFSVIATAPYELCYTVLGIVLCCSANRTNKINGIVVICYVLFEFLIGVGRGLSHYR